jgi:DNA-directed RNA polymerase specialized sigma24 family protein
MAEQRFSDDEVERLLALLVRLTIGSQADTIVEMNKVGFGPSRIANLLGTSPGTVNVAINRAKKRPKRVSSDG